DAIDAAPRGLAGPAEAARHAGQSLQLECNMLEDVRGPGALVQAPQEAATLAVAAVVFLERRQPARQSRRKARKQVGGKVLQGADVDERLEDRPVGPPTGAADEPDFEDLDVLAGNGRGTLGTGCGHETFRKLFRGSTRHASFG